MAHAVLALMFLMFALLVGAAYMRHRREREYRRGHSDYSKFERRRDWFG
jgi:hypothetical protein